MDPATRMIAVNIAVPKALHIFAVSAKSVPPRSSDVQCTAADFQLRQGESLVETAANKE
jgi:hypothetical protein